MNGVRDDRIEWLHKLVGNLLGPDGEHIHHCFDYLRQTIQCAGDMSIEWAREAPEGVQRKAVDGWGIPHECKNWVSWYQSYSELFAAVVGRCDCGD